VTGDRETRYARRGRGAIWRFPEEKETAVHNPLVGERGGRYQPRTEEQRGRLAANLYLLIVTVNRQHPSLTH
jgi:hypothetical protein